MLYDNANDYWDARRKRKEYENSPEYKMAGAQREYDANLRLAFVKLVTEAGGWEPFKARVRSAKGDAIAQRQVYLDTCEQFGIEAAGIDLAIE